MLIVALLNLRNGLVARIHARQKQFFFLEMMQTDFFSFRDISGCCELWSEFSDHGLLVSIVSSGNSKAILTEVFGFCSDTFMLVRAFSTVCYEWFSIIGTESKTIYE